MPVARARSSVLEAKLYSGFVAGRVLNRPRLAPPPEFLDGTCAVAVISAPAGYGKSTLMGYWQHVLAKQEIGCAWLSVDLDDNDPVRLLRYLIAAFQEIEPSIGRGALGELGAEIPTSGKRTLESLANDLSQTKMRAVLFLDDRRSRS
jgi:LuxR family maltose regulon positive regulatory protein